MKLTDEALKKIIEHFALEVHVESLEGHTQIEKELEEEIDGVVWMVTLDVSAKFQESYYGSEVKNYFWFLVALSNSNDTTIDLNDDQKEYIVEYLMDIITTN